MAYSIAKSNLKKAQEMYKKNKNLTHVEIANELGYKPDTIKKIWKQIIGAPPRERNINRLIEEARKIYKKDPNINPTDLAKQVSRSRSYIINIWEKITGHQYKFNNGNGVHVFSAAEDIPIALQIPDFVPKAKPFIDRDGNECTDVSEFFGIVENGGECYKNVRYTIPKGFEENENDRIS